MPQDQKAMGGSLWRPRWLPRRRVCVVNVTQASKWSVLLLAWTGLVYVCLILHKPGMLLPSYLTFRTLGWGGGSAADRSHRMRSQLGPVQHVYYLKTHKTASTTIYSILAEYCRSHDLLALLPAGIHINQKAPFLPMHVLLNANISSYDMVFNHHIYDERIFTYLHNDTFKFTTLREPFRHFISSFHYFRESENFRYLQNINTSNPLESYLAHPRKYEVRGYASFTNNRQSVDLGFNVSYSFHNLTYIKSFIADTQQRFDLVLITDYFHESLVLLRRMLRWTTTDILYYKKLVSPHPLNVSRDTEQRYRQQHGNFSTADIQLYNHFLPVFKEKMSQEPDLMGEVAEFETVLARVHSFCDRRQAKDNRLIVDAGTWTDEITITYSKCKWLQLDEVSFTKYLKKVRQFTVA